MFCIISYCIKLDCLEKVIIQGNDGSFNSKLESIENELLCKLSGEIYKLSSINSRIVKAK